MKRNLVILTTHFGTNFSGGSTATCEIFSRLEDVFQSTIVIGNELGDHPFRSIQFIPYRNHGQAMDIIRSFKQSSSLFYGDFFNSLLFMKADRPFLFTYHDNWPALAETSPIDSRLGRWYIPIYQQIFESALHTFAVSDYSAKWIKKWTNKFSVVHNGFGVHASHDPNQRADILMVGNLSRRKYELALQLFERIKQKGHQLTIDIFGKPEDPEIETAIEQYDFVNYLGHHKRIPYSSYQILLHTSTMENLPIVFCEAISQKTPILTFDVGGSNELVSLDNGRLIEAYDLDALEHTLLEMIRGNIQLNPDTSVLDEYSWDNAAKHYLQQLNMND